MHDVSVRNLEEYNRINHVEGTYIPVLCQKTNKRNTSGTVGVSFSKQHQKWSAAIYFKNVQYRLGMFSDINDAIKARKEAEERLHVGFLEWYRQTNGDG